MAAAVAGAVVATAYLYSNEATQCGTTAVALAVTVIHTGKAAAAATTVIAMLL